MIVLSKPAHKSITIVANTILALLAVADMVQVLELPFVGAEWYVGAISALNIGLRWIKTIQPVTLKGGEPVVVKEDPDGVTS